MTFAFASRALQGPRFLFLDVENHLIADEVHSTGQSIALPSTHSEAPAGGRSYPVHNHPSGDPTPSRDDVEMTRRLREALDPLGIVLHDHL